MDDTGHVMVNLRIDVSDAEALIAAAHRSMARDLVSWTPGDPAPLRGGEAEIITDPAAAVVELLVEAWVRCYGGYTAHEPLIEAVPAAQWGDVDDKEFYPHRDDPFIGFAEEVACSPR